MKKVTKIIIITASVIAVLCIALFAIFMFIDPEGQSFTTNLFHKNVKEIKYGSLTVKMKDGYNYDLSGEKYWDCSFCSCCEEGWCDWHCEAGYDSGLDVACGCDSGISLFDFATFTFPETLAFDEIYHDSTYFNKDELFDVYVHIAKKLTDKENLKDSEILEIANCYKKLSATIDIYQQTNPEFIDSLPEMPELYKDMKEDIQRLLFDRNLIISLSYINRDVANYIAYECVTMTDACPIENLRVVCLQDDPDFDTLYILSDSGRFYFSIDVYDANDNWTATLNYITNPPAMFSQKQISEMLEISVKITDTDSEIPIYHR